MISLTDGTTTIELPGDIQWVNEFDWSDIEQQQEYSIAGNLIVQQGVKLAGRPINLQSGQGSWVMRSVVLQLQALYNSAANLTLSFWGTDYTVAFKRPDGFSAKEVTRLANPGSEHNYTINLAFIEVTTE
ncbi:hypothetical protein [Gilvimarinus sp. 1_MG-2023]|uniref:hypothetical protein n=1 Tax=Gilvimarinus sp. 1_MG-2023 TaxID=3062638 RepID=UPI0026E1D23E|nr:hypothetical protein [Gilvimarinus sp. 1_MG-2023]MDO6747214.1 hypothetical protein [Gilvimarinus sp. 1_MG-2023]